MREKQTYTAYVRRQDPGGNWSKPKVVKILAAGFVDAAEIARRQYSADHVVVTPEGQFRSSIVDKKWNERKKKEPQSNMDIRAS